MHGGELLIIVANNSVGVNLEDIEAIFDRYRILDYFERKSERGLSFQGDLRLAICHSTAKAVQPRLFSSRRMVETAAMQGT